MNYIRAKRLVPEIRFKNFTDAWQSWKLENKGFLYSGLTSKTKKDFANGNSKYISYLNVYKNFNTDLKDKSSVFIKPDDKQNVIEKGDILFTMSSETYQEVGLSSVVTEKVNEKIYLNSFCFGYRLNETNFLFPHFASFLFRSDAVRNKIILQSNGGTSRFNLSKKSFLNIEIKTPQIEEQQKIGQLFYTLDKIVSLYERKINLFEKLRKYFLQNMFVKENEGKPNVRFNKFDTLWTQKNIEDNFIIDGGGFVSKQEIKNNPGQYPVYSSQTSNNGKMGSINYYKYDGEFITWTTRGALAGSIFYRNEKFSVSNAGLLQAKDNQLSDVKFYYYVLKNSNLRTIMTIGSIPQFTVQMIKNINCIIPDNKEEQEQISNFLTHIDITHAQLKRKQKPKNGLFLWNLVLFEEKSYFLHKHLI
ncbi:restriction endonuclease subunit S [Mycoplasma sp. 1654_15]|uniref:restriction endonuclease subunit S n=1 Tax=Mycoplasma sp. 1654_15 TaxID=2725994 RepID=UPI00159A2D10|nr:restriction endonuclease subunit S [Mycoplasma sp. 1654_15]QKG28169.1 restriction endonuclease subunit S [Mycoplasma sp. 1654_15]